MSGRKRMTIVLALALAAGLVLAFWLWRRSGRLPGPGSRLYEEMVSAFSSGVAALDSDAGTIARDALTRATQLVPAEPAAWADLGLAHIRLGDLETAARVLEQARTLAPEAGSVERLLALLEERRGRFADSIGHLKRAIELDPDDLKSRYALVLELDRQGGAEAEAEALRILGRILEADPDNLAALLDRARLAAKAGDSAALAGAVRQLGERSASWPDRVREQLRSLEEAAGGTNLRPVITRVIVLRNVLLTVPAFRQDIDALMLPVGTVGEPLPHFLRLAVPTPTPAPRDETIAYTVETLGKSSPQKADALFLLTDVKGGTAVPLEADGRGLRKFDGSGEVAVFPGGPSPTPPSPRGVAVADWNSDYRLDLILAGAGGVRILRQKEDGSFEDVTAATGLGPEVLAVDAFGVWAADIELDGDLDLVVGVRAGPTLVLRNNGDGTFAAIPPFASVANSRDFAWADLDHDGDPDAAFLDDKGTLTVIDNERSGQFRTRPVPGDLGARVAIAIADLDGDGAMDLLLLGPGAIHRLSDREEGRSWDVAEVARLSDRPGAKDGTPRVGEARLFAADLDNNGGIDLIGALPGATRIWLGDEAGGLSPVATSPGLRVLAISDLTGDGRLDLAGLSTDGRSVRAVGRGTKSYNWQTIQPRAAKAVGDGRINSFGVGGEVQVRAGLLVQTQVIEGPALHFGLGTHAGADVSRVVWPNGTAQAEFNTKANQTVVAEQRLKGSCPFVYAFDGSEVRFVTDFLWRSPLGLRINAQDTAGVSQTEDWIKIRGDQLAPRDGYYDIRITAELWETHFWDHVSLTVVDHPEGTEVFVDERFARQPPALAVHLTGRPRPVASARDDRGRDVTDVVRARDGRFLDTFGRGFYQGVTRDHWVEVEIGEEVPRDRRLCLVAEGWVHPTDSSINVALGQGKHDAPKGLVLEVPTAEGGWVEARADVGFPAGKNKTILVDLDGVFRPGTPRRLRLRTNLEIFWDALSIATVEDQTPLKTRRIAPSFAELQLRGYSLMTQADQSSPEVPRYDKMTGMSQRWNDLIGLYTRFGDVRELLEGVDDRYVIANAGDELTLRFPASEAPPPGWVRDYVLIGDGWNKDGDYNTAFSKTVLPLPSHSRPAYDTPPGELEEDPVYQRYPADWEQYHTRHVTPRIFRDGLRPRPRPIASP